MSSISLFVAPPGYQNSDRYRDRFNEVARQNGIGIRWTSDNLDPFEVNPGEIEIDQSAIDAYHINSAKPDFFTEPLAKDIRRTLEAIESARLGLVEKSFAYNQRFLYRAPVELLSKAEQRALALLNDSVAPIVDRIEARQQDANADALAAWMGSRGDFYSKIIYSRLRSDVCAGIPYAGDNACSLFPFYPNKPPISGMIDSSIPLDEFNWMNSTGSSRTAPPQISSDAHRQ